jgi:hypothetical protein
MPSFPFGGWHGRGGGRFPTALVVLCGAALLGGLVMLLWNWLMPTLFPGVGIIGYWQALGVLLLSRILFGGGRGHWRGHHHHWDGMSAEERERLKRHFKNRWESRAGFHGREDAASRFPDPPERENARGAEAQDRPPE